MSRQQRNTDEQNQYTQLLGELYVAINSNDIRKVAALIKEGADINSTSQVVSPLDYAIISNLPQMIAILIAKGAKEKEKVTTILAVLGVGSPICATKQPLNLNKGKM